MNHTILTAVLGTFFAVCVAADYSADLAVRQYQEQGEAIAAMAELTGTGVSGNGVGFLAAHSLEQLSEHYSPPERSAGKILIPVPVINQYPELPVGCEITSAAALLNYLGYPVDKVEMQEKYLEDSYDFRFEVIDGKKVRLGPDPTQVFVGNPKDTGFGCLSPVIVQSLNRFFSQQGSANYAIPLENANQATLEALLDRGIPIEVWASRNMKPFKYTANNEWIIESTGELFRWPGNAHALVLVGYDQDNYYFSDCDDKTEIQSYLKSDFLMRWEQFGSQGVIVRLMEPLS